MIKAFLAAALCGLGGGVALAQGAMPGTVKPFASVRFAPDPDVACLASALETGNPATGASTWILKAPAGCVVPWHSHTAQEQLIVVAGEVVAEMTDHPPTLLGPGGFAMMAGRMAHQFTCQGRDGCVMFVTFDRAYDIKWEKAARWVVVLVCSRDFDFVTGRAIVMDGGRTLPRFPRIGISGSWSDLQVPQKAIDESLGAGAAGVGRRVSVNFGVVQGGVKINMLPAECVLDVDFRLNRGHH